MTARENFNNPRLEPEFQRDSRDPFRRSQEIIRDWGVGKCIENCINLLLPRQRLITDDPYKTTICTLRRKEFMRDLFELFQYDDSRHNDNDLTMQTSLSLVVFGSTECIGLQHVSKLISTSSIMRLKSIALLVKEALGSFPRNLKSRNTDATFIEVGSIRNCLSHKIAIPKSHSYELSVEGIVKGDSIDECLNLFIRRIAEEAYQADQSPVVISAHVKACLNARSGKFQSINVKAMKTQRQQVLTTLKSAIMDDGDIYLEFYLFVKRTLPCLSESAIVYAESTQGFIRIIRRYRFIYSSSSNRGRMRSFSKHPFESLGLGIFFDIEDAKLYKSMFIDHSSGMVIKSGGTNNIGSKSNNSFLSKRGGGGTTTIDTNSNGKGGNESSEAIQTAISEYLVYLSCQSLKFLNTGDDMMKAFENLIIFYSILTSHVKYIPYCMLQLASICKGMAANFHSVIEAVNVLRSVMALTVEFLEEIHDIEQTEGGGLGSNEEAVHKTQLVEKFKLVSYSVLEIKYLIQGISRDIDCSDLRSVSKLLHQTLHRLFERNNLATPCVNSELLETHDLLGCIYVVKASIDCLQQLEFILKMLEVSIAGDSLVNILKLDMGDGNQTLTSSSLSKQKGKQKEKPIEIEFDILPKKFIDFLGFVNDMSKGQRSNWCPYQPSLALLAIFRTNNSISSLDNLSNLQKQTELLQPQLSHDFMDIFASLFFNCISLSGGIDLLESVNLESKRYEIPKAITCEGSMLRYLVETHFYRAFHEALFTASMKPPREVPYTIICSYLHKFSSFLQLHNGVTNEKIETHMFAKVRRNKLQDLKKYSGACRFSIHKSFLGGIYGLDRALCAMNNPFKVFHLSWLLPPLFPYVPVSPSGFRISIHSGISLGTALSWSKFNITEMRQNDSDLNKDFGVKINNYTKLQARTAAQPRDESGSPNVLVDSEVGLSPYLGYIEIEVVIKVVVENLSVGDGKIGKIFADQVESCYKYLYHNPRWKLYKDIIVGDREANGNGISGKRYNASRVIKDDAFNDELKKSIALFGSASIDAAVAFPEPESRPDLSEIINILQQNFKSKKPTVDDIESNSSNIFDSSGDADAGNSDDPTYNDNDRLCAESQSSAKIQNRLRNAILCYLPCVLKFTLLGQLSERIRNVMPSQNGNRGGLKPQPPLNSSLLDGTRRIRSQSKQSVKSEMASSSSRKSGLIIGNPDDVSRLVVSTIWLSPISCFSVWDCCSDKLSSYITKEIYKKWKIYQDLSQESNRKYSRAQSTKLPLPEIYIACLLCQQYRQCVTIFRSFSSLAFKLSTTITAINLCCNLLSKESISSLDITVIGQTLIRHVCLAIRLIIWSPQCVHLIGGCVLILRKVAELEKVLKLSPLSLLESMKSLPSTIPSQSTLSTDIGSMGIKKGKTKKDGQLSGESELRNALSIPESIIDANRLLHELLIMTTILLYPLITDLYENLSQFQDLMVNQPKLASFESTKEVILGSDHIPAVLETWIRRSNQEHNQALNDDKEMKRFHFENTSKDDKTEVVTPTKNKIKSRIFAKKDEIEPSSEKPLEEILEKGPHGHSDSDEEEFVPKRAFNVEQSVNELANVKEPEIAKMIIPSNNDVKQFQVQETNHDFEDEDPDPLFPDYTDNNISKSISISGFKLAGDSVIAEAADGKSMLSLLRKYHQVSALQIPNEDDISLRIHQSDNPPRGLLAFRQLARMKENEIMTFNFSQSHEMMQGYDNDGGEEDI